MQHFKQSLKVAASSQRFQFLPRVLTLTLQWVLDGDQEAGV